MGWASFREDIESRQFHDLDAMRVKSCSAPASPRSTRDSRTTDSRRDELKSTLKSFTASTARPLPVVILADTSGSMSTDGKIDALNTALRDMVATFAALDEGRAEIHLAIVTFGGSARVHQELARAADVRLQPLGATGTTPFSAALDLARELIEDKQRVPSRAYTPAIVVVSDGKPDEGWEPSLERLVSSARAGKAQRFALGIGEDADAEVLRRFLGNVEAKVYGAADAAQIKSFFRWVTMSVSARSRSMNPNESSVAALPPSDLDELL